MAAVVTDQQRSTRSTARSGLRVAVEPLEGRVLFSSDVPVPTSPPPRVEAAYVGGSAWSPAFRDYLQAIGLGSASLGRRVSFPTFSTILHWVNLDEVSVQFSSDMEVGPEDLRVRGVGGREYPVEGFRYDFNYRTSVGTATWTIGGAGFVRPDRLTAEIDADPETGGVVQRGSRIPLDGDGDHVPGGDFQLSLNVVPGSANQNTIVRPLDYATVRSRLSRSTAQPGVGGGSYSHVFDLDGNGGINVVDLIHVRRRLYDRLPRPDATAAPSDGTASTLTTSTAQDLFSARPILA